MECGSFIPLVALKSFRENENKTYLISFKKENSKCADACKASKR